MKKLKYLFAIALPLLIFASCEHEDLSIAEPNENIRPAGDFVKNNYEMKLFYAALKKVGYVEQLNLAGPFTLLVPTDAAFNALGIYHSADFDKMNTDSLKKVIGYHLLPRNLRVGDIPADGIDVRYTTLAGPELYASLASRENRLYFDGSKVTRQNVSIANGTLHVLDKVMKPNFEQNVQQWLAGREDYKVFVAGLKKFGLWDQLAGKGPFTIFAPNNEGLEAVGITEESLNAMDRNIYMGDLLFGAYIMYDRHFFISDSHVFSLINQTGGFNYFLKNDSHYMNYSSTEAYPDFKLTFYLTLREGSGSFDPQISSVTGNITIKNDNLCSNGLVHHLNDGLVSPDQAVKQ